MKITPENTAFDIDGVVADTMGLFFKIARRDFGITDICYSDITEYFLEDCLDIDPEIIGAVINRITEDNSGIDLLPMDGAVETLSMIGLKTPLLFVTARPKLDPVERWIRRVLPIDPSRVKVIATGSFKAKVDVLKDHGIRSFVDDRLETCFHLHENEITPLLFSHPWNRRPHPFHSVCDWAEIAELFDLP